jgi:hypothetical protein
VRASYSPDVEVTALVDRIADSAPLDSVRRTAHHP